MHWTEDMNIQSRQLLEADDAWDLPRKSYNLAIPFTNVFNHLEYFLWNVVFFMLSIWFIAKCIIKLMFWKPEISFKMCCQNAANVISGIQILNFLGEHSPIPPRNIVPSALAPQYFAKFPPLTNCSLWNRLTIKTFIPRRTWGTCAITSLTILSRSTWCWFITSTWTLITFWA
jgi:hypothetical protein